MYVTALIMAGGRGLRLKPKGEKPLIKICGEPMIKYVIDALKGTSRINRIIVAVSRYTPKTAAFAKEQGLAVLQTPGRGFCLDLRYAVIKLKLGAVLAICADLPLITSEFINKVITSYEKCKKPALTVAAPLEIYKKIGLSTDFIFNVNERELVPIGVNMIDGVKVRETVGELEEEILVVEDIEAVVNVNTPEDMRVAELMLQTRAFNNRSK